VGFFGQYIQINAMKADSIVMSIQKNATQADSDIGWIRRDQPGANSVLVADLHAQSLSVFLQD
jgi:hypothetical protein